MDPSANVLDYPYSLHDKPLFGEICLLANTTSSKFPIKKCRFPIANAAMTVPLKDYKNRWNTMFWNFLNVNYFKSPNLGLPFEDLQTVSVLLAALFETSALLTPEYTVALLQHKNLAERNWLHLPMVSQLPNRQQGGSSSRWLRHPCDVSLPVNFCSNTIVSYHRMK